MGLIEGVGGVNCWCGVGVNCWDGGGIYEINMGLLDLYDGMDLMLRFRC